MATMAHDVAPDGFDPLDFAIVPPRTFEQLVLGEVFRAPSRTLTDAHASAFQAVSADNHPVHYDEVWAKAHGHSAPVVHGLQVLAFTAPGATLFPHVIGEVFIAFTSVSAEFLGEVHAGGHALLGAADHRARAGGGERSGHGGRHGAQPALGGRAAGRAPVPAAEECRVVERHLIPIA